MIVVLDVTVVISPWKMPPSVLHLAENEVHIWKAALRWDEIAQLSELLAPDELARATRFHFAKDTLEYTIARGLLRLILSTYLEVKPQTIEFAYNAYGKPSLASESSNGLQFNLSHSHGLALYAITRSGSVGIDLEYIRQDLAWQQIAQQYFSPAEVTALNQVAEVERCQAFFHGWTRKEAYIKARGQGLSIPLNQVEVSLDPESAALLTTPHQPQAIDHWTLHAITPEANYTGAIAITGKGHPIRYWQGSPQLWLSPCPHFRQHR